jgi:hypothetical protein
VHVKKARETRAFFMGSPDDQLRSARGARVDAPESVAIVVEPAVAPAVEPELIEPEVAPVPAAVEPALEPAAEPCAAAPVLPGVPVVPIGVFWVLCWPAPTAGSVAGAGGVLCADAIPNEAAAMAAARILSEDISGTP